MAGKSSEQQKVEREIVESESMAKNRDGMRIVPAAEAESVKEDYPGTFDDYLEMVIQFGYVFLFGMRKHHHHYHDQYSFELIINSTNCFNETKSEQTSISLLEQLLPFWQRNHLGTVECVENLSPAVAAVMIFILHSLWLYPVLLLLLFCISYINCRPYTMFRYPAAKGLGFRVVRIRVYGFRVYGLAFRVFQILR